jgi:ribosomal protein S18 acetylase RimI-like enzyme
MEKIVTNRLVMTLASLSDLPELEIIERECDEYFLFDPPCDENHSCSLKDCITIGDIPEDGKKENYYFYCIRQNGIVIGFLAYYLEHQKKDTAYLSVIYVNERNRKNGIGNEILESVVNVLSSLKIKEIRTHVSLKNIDSLKFFVRQGFNRIINIEGKGILFPENFAGIELSKEI